jgi:hypothetical protein
MRFVITGCGFAALLLLTGCNNFGKMPPWARTPEAPIPTTVPTSVQLVKYLNDNSDRVTQLKCEEVDIQCSQGLQIIPGLHGRLDCEKPRNMRLRAFALGKEQVDVGSNDKEFWYWIPKGDNIQFHCSYQALADGKVKSLPFPFQPEWVMEAMGLANYGTGDRYQLKVEAEHLKLEERTMGSQGKMVRKVIVFRRRPSQAPQPQVVAYLLLDDATGKEICSARISEVQIDKKVGAILPRRLELYWPEQKLTMRMTLNQVSVNEPPLRRDLLYTRQQMQNVQSYDLAQRAFDSPVQRAGGTQ